MAEDWTDRAEVVATGFGWAEACRVDADGSVVFSDGEDGGIYRWSPDRGSGVEVVIPKRRRVGGLVFHNEGGLIVAGRDVRHVRPGHEDRVLISAGDGNDFVGFNDLCALADGSLLVGFIRFEPYGISPGEPGARPLGGYVRHDGVRYETVIHDIEFANGCADSWDGSVVYAVDFADGRVLALEGGTVRLFANTPAGSADGMAIDEDGGVWVVQADRKGLVRFHPSGAVDREIGLDFVTSSLAFDGDVMYVTTGPTDGARGSLLRMPAPVRGPRARWASI